MVHISVLKKEILGHLNPQPGDRIIDGTLDGGGHAYAFLEKIAPGGTVLGIEQDGAMIAALKSKIQISNDKLWENLIVAHGNFRNIDAIAKKNNFVPAQGILLDLGMSTWHLRESGRGFSFQKPDEPLLMNLDSSGSANAAALLSGLPEKELERIFREYGEERRSRFIARMIVTGRKKIKIRSVDDLIAILGVRNRKSLARIFQALRIAVNDELEALREGIEHGIAVLAPQGQLAIISYHSLEDRIVKQLFNTYVKTGRGTTVTKKPIIPTHEEIRQNPSSRSAKLRIFKKT